MCNKKDLSETEIEIWNTALEYAARAIEEFHLSNTGIPHPIAVADAKRIRNLKI
jgi:hypothetical protein